MGNNERDGEKEGVFILIRLRLWLHTASEKDEFVAVIYIYEFLPFGPV